MRLRDRNQSFVFRIQLRRGAVLGQTCDADFLQPDELSDNAGQLQMGVHESFFSDYFGKNNQETKRVPVGEPRVSLFQGHSKGKHPF